jgi:hypothetical protein
MTNSKAWSFTPVATAAFWPAAVRPSSRATRRLTMDFETVSILVRLAWLAAGGHISVESQNGTVLLSRGKGESNPYLQKELFVAIRGILEETAAYRAHFARANSESLFDPSAY